MLQLDSISLVQFKNYISREFRFHSRIVGISGANGVGKTNLLDAVYYLCFTKSYFGRSDAQNVHAGMQGFRIQGGFGIGDPPRPRRTNDAAQAATDVATPPDERTGGHIAGADSDQHISGAGINRQTFNAVCIVRENGKKEFLLNGEAYEKFAQHVGKFPCVIIAPDDVRIITEGSEERRRFIDAILSQLDAEYLQRLINYNKILQQRNSYLKSIAENKTRDMSLLEVYDQQLVKDGEFVFRTRKDFLEHCIGRVKDFYRQISGTEELVELKYESQLLHLNFPDLLRSFREKDLLLQRTNGGAHKDDIQILLNRQPFKNIASQGQRKSLLFALKLAEYQILKENKSFAPLLLLDDVFEKLDEDRMHNLLDWVCVKNDGQIFLTDTHPERISAHFDALKVDYQLINL